MAVRSLIKHVNAPPVAHVLQHCQLSIVERDGHELCACLVDADIAKQLRRDFLMLTGIQCRHRDRAASPLDETTKQNATVLEDDPEPLASVEMCMSGRHSDG